MVLEALASNQSIPDSTQDGVARLAIHSHEVVSVHLPDEGALEPIVVSIPHLDININSNEDSVIIFN